MKPGKTGSHKKKSWKKTLRFLKTRLLRTLKLQLKWLMKNLFKKISKARRRFLCATQSIYWVYHWQCSMDEALNVVKGFLSEDRVHTVYTPNSEIMMAAQRDPELKKILCEADLLVPDGAGVVLASKINGCPLKEEWRVSTLQTCCFRTKPQKLSISFFSRQTRVAEEAYKTF